MILYFILISNFVSILQEDAVDKESFVAINYRHTTSGEYIIISKIQLCKTTDDNRLYCLYVD